MVYVVCVQSAMTDSFSRRKMNQCVNDSASSEPAYQWTRLPIEDVTENELTKSASDVYHCSTGSKSSSFVPT